MGAKTTFASQALCSVASSCDTSLSTVLLDIGFVGLGVRVHKPYTTSAFDHQHDVDKRHPGSSMPSLKGAVSGV